MALIAQDNETAAPFTASPQQERFLKALADGGQHLLLEARAGSGKCLGGGTPVMLHGGSVVPAETIEEGDRLMGPDSEPRTVISTSSGWGPLYQVTPVKGDPWICNESHILTLRDSVTKNEFDIELDEYQSRRNSVALRDAKLFRVGVSFPAQPTPLAPYLVGLWLGDGSRGTSQITNPEPEIIEYLTLAAKQNGLVCRQAFSAGKNPCSTISLVQTGGQHYRSGTTGDHPKNAVRTEFTRCVVAGEKRVPREYLVNSRENRLQLLAGLMDTDGHLHSGYYEIITKFSGLRDDILFLARSLGLAAYAKVKIGTIRETGFRGSYWRIGISGHINAIPARVKRKQAEPRRQKKDVTNTGFAIEPRGEGPFFGFTLDGDGRFLLGDFTVTHNSTTCREGARRLGRRKSTYVCFNAHIAREFQQDLPSTCRAATMHSMGLQLIKDAVGYVQVDQDKVDRIAEKYFPDRCQRPMRYALGRLTSLCKSLLNDGTSEDDLATIAATYDVEIRAAARSEVLGLVPTILDDCAADTATIDFDDMVWMPVKLGLRSARAAEVLFVDEAQDLSPIQHALLDVFCPNGRVIVVGDRFQSIYHFRGADSDSIPRLESRLSDTDRGMETYPLTVTRRCPQEHVRMARHIVADLDHLPAAINGEVEILEPEGWESFVEIGDMVLARTNAPLVSGCYRLIRSGIKATVRGRDIGKGLISLIVRLRQREVAGLLKAIGDHRASEARKFGELRNPGPALQAMNDKCDCLAALCEGAKSVDEVKHRAETMFSDLNEDNAVVLSSVHRAKGLERDRIVILRPDLIPGPWAETPTDVRQELNLAYVAATRAKKVLAFAGDVPQILDPFQTYPSTKAQEIRRGQNRCTVQG
jgi:hypothetical protein